MVEQNERKENEEWTAPADSEWKTVKRGPTKVISKNYGNYNAGCNRHEILSDHSNSEDDGEDAACDNNMETLLKALEKCDDTIHCLQDEKEKLENEINNKDDEIKCRNDIIEQRNNECKENVECVNSGNQIKNNENTREKPQNKISRLKNVMKMNNEANEQKNRHLACQMKQVKDELERTMLRNLIEKTCDNLQKNERHRINEVNSLESKRREESLLLCKVHVSSCVSSMRNETKINVKPCYFFDSNNFSKLTSCSGLGSEPVVGDDTN